MARIDDLAPRLQIDSAEIATSVIPAAWTLPERLELFRSNPELFSKNPEKSDRRKAQWVEAMAIDEDGFEDRLRTLGIKSSELPWVLGDVRSGNLEQPSWWSVCEEVLTTPSGGEEDRLPERTYLTPPGVETDDEMPIPFEHVFCGWIDVATKRLRAQVPDLDSILGPTVLRKEQRGLLENCSLITRNILLGEFARAKASTYDSNDLLVGLLSPTPPRDLYAKIVQEAIADRTAGLMTRYPALARLMATRVECWIRTLAEFAERLAGDRGELERCFSPESKLGRLVDGGRGVSDSHNGGRAVVICKFENGTRIVYKPRSMSIDVAWTELVEFFNSRVEEDAQLRPLRVLDRGLYGWMEFADRKACRDTTELQTFYRRMGSLLGLIHMLQGNDFHLENVVAAGPNPIAIDLETISVGDALVDRQGQTPDPAAMKVEKSVLRALLLPSVMSMRGRDGVRNMGAVGVEIAANNGVAKRHRRMSQINTDFQRWVQVDGADPTLKISEQSRPTLENGDPVDSDLHRSDVAEGYRTAYKSILEHREEWLAPDGPLALMNDAWGRVLNRATNIYYRLFLETCGEGLLKSGLDRWIHGQRFRVGTTPTENRDPEIAKTYNAIVDSEEAALTRGDVAYFIARGSGTEYHAPDYRSGEATQIQNAFLENSAIDAARMQLSRMGEDDLKLQSSLITSSYLTAQMATEGLHLGDGAVMTSEDKTPEPTMDATDEETRTWVRDNLAMLRSLAIQDGNKMSWIDAEMDVASETARPAALGIGLYTGRSGLALLFERACRGVGDAEFLQSAKASVQRELELLQTLGTSNAESYFALEGPSGFSGQRAGTLAAFWGIGRHEGCGQYRDLVHGILNGITDRTIELDRDFDVISGSAGLMLMMAGMKREDPSFDHDDLLIQLGEHLSRHAMQVDGTGWGMDGGKKRPLNGFGHGRAGIGLALLETGARLDRPDFRDLGLAALRAEHEMRVDDLDGGGWPDLRSMTMTARIPKPPYFNAWCAGGEGIALSRAAALEFTDEAFIRDDLDFAIDHISRDEKGQPSGGRRRHLCCGTSGRAEMFLSLAGLLERDDLAETGRHIARRKLPPAYAAPETTSLSLMQGLPGEIWAQLSTLLDDQTHLLLLRV